MRIGIDARLWNETGVGRYIRNLVYNLQVLDKKNDYVLFVRETKKENSLFPSPYPQSANWKVVRTDIHWHTFEEQIKFPPLLNKEKLDLVHFPYFSIPIFYNKPFVVTIHDLIIFHHATGKASTLPLPYYYLKRFGYQRIMKHAVSHAKKIIVPLHTVERDLIETLHVPNERICVTYEGVDESLISQTESHIPNWQNKTDSFFLYVGNAYPHKNLERLIDAFSQIESNDYPLASNKSQVQLVLVGKEDYFYKRIKEKVLRMNLGKKVLFFGHANDDELAYLYSHALAYISPSLMEGFGLPPLEALAHHCPVLVSDIPAFRETLKNAALFFNPLNAADIADCMKSILKNGRKYYTTMTGNFSQQSAMFSWKEMTKKTLEIYNSIGV